MRFCLRNLYSQTFLSNKSAWAKHFSWARFRRFSFRFEKVFIVINNLRNILMGICMFYKLILVISNNYSIHIQSESNKIWCWKMYFFAHCLFTFLSVMTFLCMNVWRICVDMLKNTSSIFLAKHFFGNTISSNLLSQADLLETSRLFAWDKHFLEQMLVNTAPVVLKTLFSKIQKQSYFKQSSGIYL